MLEKVKKILKNLHDNIEGVIMIAILLVWTIINELCQKKNEEEEYED